MTQINLILALVCWLVLAGFSVVMADSTIYFDVTESSPKYKKVNINTGYTNFFEYGADFGLTNGSALTFHAGGGEYQKNESDSFQTKDFNLQVRTLSLGVDAYMNGRRFTSGWVGSLQAYQLSFEGDSNINEITINDKTFKNNEEVFGVRVLLSYKWYLFNSGFNLSFGGIGNLYGGAWDTEFSGFHAGLGFAL